jgi:orotidine-5'-phosphate decarboxylase
LTKKDIKLSARLIASMDVSKKRDAIEICKKLDNKVDIIKVGLELLYHEGLGMVETVKSFGYKVMLDAKLMDIPNTISGALKGIAGLGVEIVTIHTLGGFDMLKTAAETLSEVCAANKIKRPSLFGVTILTSLDDDDLALMGFKGTYIDSVLALAGLAKEAQIDGIICSPNEVAMIRDKIGDDIYIATPGIRLEGDGVGDQKRVNTPRKAIMEGADYVIAGRSITAKEDVSATIKIFQEQIEGALKDA